MCQGPGAGGTERGLLRLDCGIPGRGCECQERSLAGSA